jgi:hypothetical protein
LTDNFREIGEDSVKFQLCAAFLSRYYHIEPDAKLKIF